MNTLELKPFDIQDINEIVLAFKKIGWHKPKSLYESYFKEQLSNERAVIIARRDNIFCGYVTIKWKSDYQYFAEQNIPEIVDLNVLPNFRKLGIGTMLIQKCEQLAKNKGYDLIGLGVGLTTDYGNAQRLYVQLGFVPDGRGLHYKNKIVDYSELVTADDYLTLYFTKILS